MTDRDDPPAQPPEPPPDPSPGESAATPDSLEPAAPAPQGAQEADTSAVPPSAAPSSATSARQVRRAGELPIRPPEAVAGAGTTDGRGPKLPNDGAPRKASESQKLRIQTVERLLSPSVTHTAHPQAENHEETPDEKLVLRSMDGDNAAFEELYRRYLSRAIVAAYAVVGQREKAQDVAQEAFIEAANKLATLREPENFGGWVCGISRRMAIVAIRKESRRLNAIRDHQEELREKPRHDEPDAAAVKDEQKALIRRAIELVPAKYREILLLKYVEKLSYDEIAAMCGISRAAVDKRLTRGKKILREKMEELMGEHGGLK